MQFEWNSYINHFVTMVIKLQLFVYFTTRFDNPN